MSFLSICQGDFCAVDWDLWRFASEAILLKQIQAVYGPLRVLSYGPTQYTSNSLSLYKTLLQKDSLDSSLYLYR